MSAAKAKGTKAETELVKYLNTLDAGQAVRLPLTGGADIGDVLWDGCLFQVKAYTAPYTNGQIDGWLAEVREQRQHAVAAGYPVSFGVLALKRPRHNVRDWWLVVGNDMTGPVTFRLGNWAEYRSRGDRL